MQTKICATFLRFVGKMRRNFGL